MRLDRLSARAKQAGLATKRVVYSTDVHKQVSEWTRQVDKQET